MRGIGRKWVMGTLLTFGMGASSAEAEVYRVEAGDTLWGISMKHGCSVDALQQENNLSGALLQVGQELKLSCANRRTIDAGNLSTSGSSESFTHTRQLEEIEDSQNPSLSTIAEGQQLLALRRAPQGSVPVPSNLDKARESVDYEVRPGDTLSAISQRFKVSVDSIQVANDLRSDRIYRGQRLVLPGGLSALAMPVRVVAGQSRGRPQEGRLTKAVPLPESPHYRIRRLERRFGATHVIDHVRRAATLVRQKFPAVHPLAVGDLSARHGGRISMHSSHQSGRDVDLGFYFKRRPSSYPNRFVVGTKRNLDFEATWELLSYFAGQAGKKGGVDKIFLNYKTQRLLYKWARKRGVPKAKLQEIFQYPNGRRSREGIVRHEPGHDEHLHVRFLCPPGDEACW